MEKHSILGLKNEFEIAVVNEPPVFEPSKFQCTVSSRNAAILSFLAPSSMRLNSYKNLLQSRQVSKGGWGLFL